MSSFTVNKFAPDERRRVKNDGPATGLVRVPYANEQPVRRLDLVQDGAFNDGIRAFYRQIGSYRSECGKILRSLGLTSCYEQEGKSTVGAYLASLAAESRRVLLIDANEPRLSINTAMRDIALNGVAHANEPEFTGGQVTNGQPCIDETRDLLRLFSTKFDLVVVDLPPLDSSNVLDWAPMLDGIVLVVESERVRWQVAARGIDLLEQAGCQVLGTVINKQREYIPQWIYHRL